MRSLFYSLIIVLTMASTSYAGFEWVPPQENPKARGVQKFDGLVTPPAVKDKMVGPSHNTQIRTTPATAGPFVERAFQSIRPSSPSLSGQIQQTNGRLREKQSTDHRPNIQGIKDRPVSLYINPYPLGRSNAGNVSPQLSNISIEQAMVEQAGRVTPLPLGNHLKTGAQPSYDTTAPSKATPIAPPQLPSVQNKIKAPVAAVTRQYSKAEGFGSALPLALALSQVVPSDFTHSFISGVDPSTTVSWQGGKAWNIVLEDMLRPKGLTASIKNNAVMIAPL